MAQRNRRLRYHLMPLTRELLEKYPDNLPVGVIASGTTNVN